MISLPLHPLRQSLNDEAHARPALPIGTPARLSSLVFLFEHDNGEQLAALAALAARLGLPAPQPGAVQYNAGNAALTVRWSLHTEFVRYTFAVAGSGGDPFVQNALTRVPDDWLAAIPGRMLAGIHALLLPAADAPALPDIAASWFCGHDLIGADIADGNATALTDLRLHPDAYAGTDFSRLIVLNRGMGEHQSGRMLGRLFEIETYRMLALLALPLAKQQMRQLDHLGLALRDITSRMQDNDDDSALLADLSALATQVEDAISTSQYRFSAASAYYDLVGRRIVELRETRLPGLQPFREFMERRLAPALATCATVTGRQDRMTTRIQRATSLLRTRIEVALQAQNQQLLASMDRRAELQLRLQETVEGLSVGVLTYYAVGLVGYATKAMKAAGLHINAELATGLAIPLVGAMVWWGMHRVRRHLAQH